MNNKKAFTLIELCVVIAIIGIIALIAAPNMVTGLPKYRIKRAARDITSKIRAARSEAIKTSDDINIEFDVDDNRYRIDGQWYPDSSLSDHYGSGVSFGVGNSGESDECTFPDNSDGNCNVTFNSRGISNAAGSDLAIYLTNIDDTAYRIVINTAGNIQLQQEFEFCVEKNL
jgi:prepilin-type N-terminal cleavage/methylation domain-containing protein